MVKCIVCKKAVPEEDEIPRVLVGYAGGGNEGWTGWMCEECFVKLKESDLLQYECP